MLPLLNFFFFLLISTPSLQKSVTHGLTLKLIPPHSPESPFYNRSLSSYQRVHQCRSQTKARASNKKAECPPIEVKQEGLHTVKIGIGTFDTPDPTYKSYYLVTDTGSNLVWLQCEGCEKNTCFTQKDPPFPSSSSQTYHPRECPHNPKSCGPSYKCENQVCTYEICYYDKSHTKGVIAREKFTFDAPQGLETKEVRFGCGIDQNEVSFAKGHPENEIAGILGLGWGPDALHRQLDSETDSKFSYCFQSKHSTPHETYLTFGSDIVITPDFHKTRLNIFQSLLYSVSLKDVSINGKRLQAIPRGTGPSKEKNIMILDSGADISYLVKPVYEALVKNLEGLFSKNRNLVRKKKQGEFCYERRQALERGHEYDELPTVTFNFEEGADFVVKPDGVFEARVDEKGKQFFCLMIASDDKDNVLGSYQQANHRVVFDTKKEFFLFKSENC